MERPTGAKRGRKSKVTPKIDGFLQAAVAAQADLTLAELKERLFQEKKLEISIGWLWSTLKRLGKRLGLCFKKTLHATEQDSERVQKLRAEFRASIDRESAENIIFLDESGTTTEMIRRYGRGPVGVRVPDSAPGSWRTPTLLGAISLNGWVASMTMEAPTDGDVFLANLAHPRDGQLVRPQGRWGSPAH